MIVGLKPDLLPLVLVECFSGGAVQLDLVDWNKLFRLMFLLKVSQCEYIAVDV